MDENSENKRDKDLALQKERRARKLKRQKMLDEQRKREEEKAKQIRRTIVTCSFWGTLILLGAGCWVAINNGIASDFLSHQGQKYLEVKEYDKAIRMLKIAESMNPVDENIVYLQVMTLSRMPITYENMKKLYEISQYEDFDEASEYAFRVLRYIRQQVDAMVGANYVDYVLHDDIVYRWNNTQPIKYTVQVGNSLPSSYMTEIKRAFTAWSSLSNGAIIFNEVNNVAEADIVVSMANTLPTVDPNDTLRSAVTIPVINDDILNRVDIIIKPIDSSQLEQGSGAFGSVMKTQIGHALGIAGYSSNEADVMHFSGDYISNVLPNKNLTARDANTLTLLYKMVPDVINEPLAPEEYDDLFFHAAITSVPGDGIDNDVRELMNNLSNDVQDIPKWVDLATKYASKQHYKHANAILINVLPNVQDNPQNNFVILYNIAVNYYKQKDYSNALRYIYAARRIDATDIDAIVLQTFVELRTEHKDVAMQRLISINKKYPEREDVAKKLDYLNRKNKGK